MNKVTVATADPDPPSGKHAPVAAITMSGDPAQLPTRRISPQHRPDQYGSGTASIRWYASV